VKGTLVRLPSVRATLGALVLVAAASAAGTVEGQSPIGTVFEIRGRWIIEGEPPRVLATGSSLPSNGVIRPPGSPQSDDFLSIVYVSGDPVRFQCPDDCRHPVRLKSYPDIQRLRSWTDRIAIVERLFFGNPQRYVSALTRGGNLTDAVLRLDGDQVDVAGILTDVSRGSYSLRFRSLPGAEGAAATRESGTFTWDGQGPAIPTVRELVPDLYDVELIEWTSGQGTATGARGWVLLRDATRYRDDARAFDEAQAVTAKWVDVVSSTTRRAFLRSFLDSLASASKRP
jgi:hypothetical protein